MVPEIVLLGEVSQSEKVKYDIWGILKKRYKWTYLQNRNKLIDLEKELMVAEGMDGGESIVRELGMDMYTLLDLKWITNKDLLYITGNFAQYFVKT